MNSQIKLELRRGNISHYLIRAHSQGFPGTAGILPWQHNFFACLPSLGWLRGVCQAANCYAPSHCRLQRAPLPPHHQKYSGLFLYLTPEQISSMLPLTQKEDLSEKSPFFDRSQPFKHTCNWCFWMAQQGRMDVPSYLWAECCCTIP